MAINVWFLVVCTTRLDLGFVIDGSRAYGRRNFKRCMQFVKNLVRVFTISARFTRVGVVLYSSRPYKLFGFGRYGNRHGVVRAIGRMRYLRGRARTGRALRYARRYLFGRSKRRKVLIVMTGRKSGDNVHGPARGLRRAGIDVISLGFGKRYSTGQLKAMASSRRNVFTAGFTNLVSVVRAIKKKACGTAGEPTVCCVLTWHSLSAAYMQVISNSPLHYIMDTVFRLGSRGRLYIL